MIDGKRIRLSVPAKINWSLEVVGKRADGYHQLRSLMQTVSLYDQVELAIADSDSCQCSPPVDCALVDNLAWRAWDLLRNTYSLDNHLSINIVKDIPAGGGLGGGSADAAAVLLGVNKLFALELSVAELATLGFTLGADIPFFLYGGLAEIRGAGEDVLPCSQAQKYPLLIAIPPASLSTAMVFAAFDRLSPGAVVLDFSGLLKALQSGDIAMISAQMANMLEPAAMSLCPEIAVAKEILSSHGLFPLMSGSGSCVFALSDGDCERENAALAALQKQGIAGRKAHSLTHGIVDETVIK